MSSLLRVASAGVFAAALAGSVAFAADTTAGVSGQAQKTAAAKVCQVPPGKVVGVVVQSDNVTPQARADVALLKAATREQVATARTDRKGIFEIADVPEGRYIVRVGNPGSLVPLDVVPGVAESKLTIMLPRVANMQVA